MFVISHHQANNGRFRLLIVLNGYFVVQLDARVGLEYLIVASGSFVAILAINELLVKRLPWLRFLFGMRPERKRAGHQKQNA